MLTVGLFCAMLAASNPLAPPPLSCAKRLVLPVYPRLAKIAHDARQVSARIKVTDGCLRVVEIKGGNKYFDEAIRVAVSAWAVSSDRSFPASDFTVTFDFRLSEDAAKEGECEIDIDEGKIVIWGLMRFTDTEQLPVATK